MGGSSGAHAQPRVTFGHVRKPQAKAGSLATGLLFVLAPAFRSSGYKAFQNRLGSRNSGRLIWSP